MNPRKILAIITMLVIITNFYTLSFVINYGNYPILWNVVFIIFLILVIFGLTKLMNRKPQAHWSLFWRSCCLIFILAQLYFLTLIKY